MQLYNHQAEDKARILATWERGIKNILYVLPCGGGKTVVFSSIMTEERGYSVAIAHRREILGQISLALAGNSVPHSIIGPAKSAQIFGRQHYEHLGRSWINPNARTYVASVDTLMSRASSLKAWGTQIRLWVQDEAHHALDSNKWGKVLNLFPNARGLGVTGTPLRSDGRSLKQGQGGVFQELIQGVGQRWLINNDFLADYRIFAPTSDISLENVPVTGSGDYNKIKLAKAAHESHIVGDIVEQYLRLAPGELGVTFVTDVETANNVADQFRLKGVPSVALSAKSKDMEREEAIRNFRCGKIKQLVNVDLFGEGFDLPAIQVVSFGRPTVSYGLYVQQFARSLRKMKGKTHGKIIDHVGNVVRHGLPDQIRDWSLGIGSSPKEDLKSPPLRTCGNEKCFKLWEGYARVCPHCGFIPKITGRSFPEQVEGDLFEIDPLVLASMRANVNKISAPISEIIAPLKYAGAPPSAIAGLAAKHRKRQAAQQELRSTMALWGGYAKAIGLKDSSRQIKFFKEFGIDVLSAQGLGKPSAEELTDRVKLSLEQF